MTCPPAALLLALLAAAALAPAARAKKVIIADVAKAFKGSLPSCEGVIYPPSAKLLADSQACWGPITLDTPPPTTCPSAACAAMGYFSGKSLL